MNFGLAWIITVLVETSILCAISGWTLRHALAGFFASSLTLPWLWFVAATWFSSSTQLMLACEPVIVLVEGLFFWSMLQLPLRRAFGVSLLANLASLLIGFIKLP